jgi:hypothetical protein
VARGFPADAAKASCIQQELERKFLQERILQLKQECPAAHRWQKAEYVPSVLTFIRPLHSSKESIFRYFLGCFQCIFRVYVSAERQRRALPYNFQ